MSGGNKWWKVGIIIICRSADSKKEFLPLSIFFDNPLTTMRFAK